MTGEGRGPGGWGKGEKEEGKLAWEEREAGRREQVKGGGEG